MSVMDEVVTRDMPERSLLCLKRNVDEQGNGHSVRSSSRSFASARRLDTLARGRVVQGGQEPHDLPGRAVRVDRVGDVEQGCPRRAPGDQEHGVSAAGDDLGQERDRGSARERGQDGDLMGQLERGRTRPGEFYEELVTEGLAARVPLRSCLPAGPGTVSGYSLSSGATTRRASPSATGEHSASHVISGASVTT
jgi:hypothetical protein